MKIVCFCLLSIRCLMPMSAALIWYWAQFLMRACKFTEHWNTHSHARVSESEIHSKQCLINQYHQFLRFDKLNKKASASMVGRLGFWGCFVFDIDIVHIFSVSNADNRQTEFSWKWWEILNNICWLRCVILRIERASRTLVWALIALFSCPNMYKMLVVQNAVSMSL